MPIRRKPNRFTISSLCFCCLSIFFRCSGIRTNHQMETIERVLQAQSRTGANFMTAHLMVVHWSIHKLQTRDIGIKSDAVKRDGPVKNTKPVRQVFETAIAANFTLARQNASSRTRNVIDRFRKRAAALINKLTRRTMRSTRTERPTTS